jgi:hypothetical protein
LDEIFSVDFMNTRIKRSFGTALKVIDYRNLTNSALMIGAVYFLFLMAPDAGAFTDIFLNEEIYHNVYKRFWPSTGLFQ